MAGKKQHYIPQFLQRGFGLKKGKITRVWKCEKSKDCRYESTIGVASERFFYSDLLDAALDDKITDLEGDVYSPLVGKLRSGKIDDCDVVDIAEMLAHFEVRTKHLRLSACLVSTEFEHAFFQSLKTPSALKKIIETLSKNTKSSLKDIPLSVDAFYKILMWNLSINIEAGVDGLSNHYASLENNHVKVEEIHKDFLKKSPSPKFNMLKYATLNYSIRKYEAGDLILGDSIVIFNTSNERSYMPILDNPNELISIILPLSPSNYLIGEKLIADMDNAQQHPNLALEIARCSIDFFISSKNDESIKHYQSSIGDNSHLIDAVEIQNIIKGFWGDS